MHAGVLSRKVDGDIIMRQLSCVKVIMRQLSAAVLRQGDIAAAVSTCPTSKGMQCTRKS